MTTYSRSYKLQKGAPLVSNVHVGRCRRPESVIYAVVLHEHPSLVKVGRTSKWAQRRASYASWNLNATGDAIKHENVFEINDEFVDLAMLERAILEAMPFKIAFGNEWFEADIEDACRVIDQVMCGGGLTYTLR